MITNKFLMIGWNTISHPERLVPLEKIGTNLSLVWTTFNDTTLRRHSIRLLNEARLTSKDCLPSEPRAEIVSNTRIMTANPADIAQPLYDFVSSHDGQVVALVKYHVRVSVC